MATWATERTTLAAALTAVFKKTGTGAYQYTQVDTDISSEANIPIGQKARHFRIEAKTVEISDLTSGKVLGRIRWKSHCILSRQSLTMRVINPRYLPT